MSLAFVERCREVYIKRNEALNSKKSKLSELRIKVAELERERKEKESRYFETLLEEDMQVLRTLNDSLEAAKKEIELLAGEERLLNEGFYISYDPDLIRSEAKEEIDNNGVLADIEKLNKLLAQIETLCNSIVSKYNISLEKINESISYNRRCRCSVMERLKTNEYLNNICLDQYYKMLEERVFDYSSILPTTTMKISPEEVKKGAE